MCEVWPFSQLGLVPHAAVMIVGAQLIVIMMPCCSHGVSFFVDNLLNYWESHAAPMSDTSQLMCEKM